MVFSRQITIVVCCFVYLFVVCTHVIHRAPGNLSVLVNKINIILHCLFAVVFPFVDPHQPLHPFTSGSCLSSLDARDDPLSADRIQLTLRPLRWDSPTEAGCVSLVSLLDVWCAHGPSIDGNHR